MDNFSLYVLNSLGSYAPVFTVRMKNRYLLKTRSFIFFKELYYAMINIKNRIVILWRAVAAKNIKFCACQNTILCMPFATFVLVKIWNCACQKYLYLVNYIWVEIKATLWTIIILLHTSYQPCANHISFFGCTGLKLRSNRSRTCSLLIVVSHKFW